MFLQRQVVVISGLLMAYIFLLHALFFTYSTINIFKQEKSHHFIDIITNLKAIPSNTTTGNVVSVSHIFSKFNPHNHPMK